MGRDQGLDRNRPAGRRRNFDHHRLAAERGQDMPVGRIARARDRDPVARLEVRQECQDEAGGRAGGHHDALGLYRDTMRLCVMLRDALAQRRNAERLGVADVAEVERRPGGIARGLRRRRGRLADLHVHDAPAARLDAGCRRHYVHHHEGRNVAARRRGDQVTRLVQHHASNFPLSAKTLACLTAAAIGGFCCSCGAPESVIGRALTPAARVP
jgi:hypothetical protein